VSKIDFDPVAKAPMLAAAKAATQNSAYSATPMSVMATLGMALLCAVLL
jgi:hypothetical protein